MSINLGPQRAVLEQLAQALTRLGLSDEPALVGDLLPGAMAELARAIDDRHRQAESAALSALSRGDVERAVRILQAAAGER